MDRAAVDSELPTVPLIVWLAGLHQPRTGVGPGVGPGPGPGAGAAAMFRVIVDVAVPMLEAACRVTR